ncbi:hypothetical protein CEUSTIGMA_g12152.t1 [Chlamydomonas eustigma]|uniref:Uncharacterized protein n=1 Tax=Chlamydomonas eustigma TaxID=1157962 RepID=A0A250XPK6_9CHLO|nr:hypothetical protein CEUSTIGMA_g12152.t1 [Chlamydomonas eustigma]|eukprot:GAX84730.1 hypothetical protein CEUSTIGMA_g12152.t1 [Chlamydomonas eustigma]
MSKQALRPGLAQIIDLASSTCSSTAVGTVAAAFAFPFVSHRLNKPLTAHAEALIFPFSAASPLLNTGGSYIQTLHPFLSTFHPRNLLLIFARSMGLQVLLRFNGYMLQLLEHEKVCIEAEEQGLEEPPPPPIPDFKPCFDRGLQLGCREVAVSSLRRIYELLTVLRLGRSKADIFLRDAKLWIRDVLAFKYRHRSVVQKFVAYEVTVLHSFVLFYSAECTVAVFLHTTRSLRRRGKSGRSRGLFILRGAAAQVIRCSLQLALASMGACLGSLINPGPGTSVGLLIFDFAAFAALSPLVELIAGE